MPGQLLWKNLQDRYESLVMILPSQTSISNSLLLFISYCWLAVKTLQNAHVTLRTKVCQTSSGFLKPPQWLQGVQLWLELYECSWFIDSIWLSVFRFARSTPQMRVYLSQFNGSNSSRAIEFSTSQFAFLSILNVSLFLWM